MATIRSARLGKACAGVAVALALGGCATTANNPKDPLEGFNRAMFSFNDGVDKAIFKPVAKGYDAVAPVPVRTGVGNFFGNVGDVFIGVNNLLQGKAEQGFSDLGRFLINSTVGIFGLFDVASELGIDKHDEDFGQTLGTWGVGEGVFIVWPLIGPKTARDTFGFAVDSYVDPIWLKHDIATRNSLYSLRFVDARATLLPADKVVEEAALDKYSYLRDAYLQRRRSLVNDGRRRHEEDEE